MPETSADLRLGDVATFLAVCRRRSINGTARELGINPSQVSKAVSRLERTLGIRLLVRANRGVSVSAQAERVIPHLEKMVASLQDIQTGKEVPVRLLTVAAPSYLLSFLLSTTADAVPLVRLRGLQLAPALLRVFAVENYFDLALSGGLEQLPSSWASLQVGEIRRGLFAQPQLARSLGKGPILVGKLRGVPFISATRHAEGQFVPIGDGCPLAPADRQLGCEVETMALALDLATHVPQVVFGPVLSAQSYVEQGRLEEIRVAGWHVADPVYLACNGDRVLATVQRAISVALRAGLAVTASPRPGLPRQRAPAKES